MSSNPQGVLILQDIFVSYHTSDLEVIALCENETDIT